MTSNVSFRMGRPLVVALLLVLTGAGAASAQAPGPILSAVGSAIASESHTGWAGSVSFGYRFNSSVELQIEFTGAPQVRQEFDGPRIAAGQPGVAESIMRRANAGRAGPLGFVTTDMVASGLRTSLVPIRDEPGRALFFTTNARLHLPLTTTRIVPFVTAGGGVGQLQRKQVIDYGPLILPYVTASGSSALVAPGAQPADRLTYTFTDTAMVLTLGGGLAVKVTDRFSVDADLRYFRTLSNQDMNIGRFGGGVSYRF